MKKTLIIIAREYLSRVKKRSFVIMTILGPLLLASLMIVPYFIAKMDNEQKVIDVVDETGIYDHALGSNKTIRFNYLKQDIKSATEAFDESRSTALLYIPRPVSVEPTHAILYYSNKQPGLTVTSYIQDKMKYVYENQKLLSLYGIDKEKIDETKVSVNISMENIRTGEKNYPVLTTLIGVFAGILIYFSIFMYGSQVMRGVIEEKTSRIVEVIVSSVKPFQLLVGKITGIALVGLTQFVLWLVLTLGIVGIFRISMQDRMPSGGMQQDSFTVQNNNLIPDQTVQVSGSKTSNDEVAESLFNTAADYDFVAIVGAFLFFFLFGYLLYSALFAAIGSAVDSEADTQQFMLPITIPLILAFVMAQNIIENPQGSMAFWLSVFPLT